MAIFRDVAYRFGLKISAHKLSAYEIIIKQPKRFGGRYWSNLHAKLTHFLKPLNHVIVLLRQLRQLLSAKVVTS